MILHSTVAGPEDAPVLVLGPSLGTATGLFDTQAVFADRYRVVRFDLPGHGGSPVPAGPLTIGDITGDVLATLDGLGIGRFHYAGVSIGGAIGQHLGIHSDRLDSLTVMATAARFPDPASWSARAATVREQGTEFLVESRRGVWFTDAFADERPGEAAALIEMLRGTSREGYAACCEAIGSFDVVDDLGRIGVPTLVIAGKDDPATPPDIVSVIADGVPGARYLALPGAHLINVEAAEAVNEALAAHLDR